MAAVALAKRLLFLWVAWAWSFRDTDPNGVEMSRSTAALPPSDW